MLTELNQNEMSRYQRHFPIIGIEGQEKLKSAKILCVGAGGLGCAALQYLAASGVGTLGIIDGDQVELSNLQRQILFNEKDIGRNKATVIAERLNQQNSHVIINIYSNFLADANAADILSAYDLILDATDNFKSRYLLNAFCRTLKKPLISASIHQFEAQISVFNYFDGPCYQCLYPEPSPVSQMSNCATGGVLGVLPGVAGTLQATEAIKILLGTGNVLSGILLSFNLLTMQFNQYKIVKQHCDAHPTIHSDIPSEIKLISAKELASLLASHKNHIQLIDVRQAHERASYHIDGIHIPLAELESNLAQLEKNMPTIVYCKSGGRSMIACNILLAAGFKDVCNLDKGILGWIEAVDTAST